LNFKRILISVLSFCLILCIFAGCSPVDRNYGVSSEVDTAEPEPVPVENDEIMSSDRVMSKYFDISLFDEENYADIYLGKKFKLDTEFLGQTLKVPATLEEMEDAGWTLADGNTYDSNSLVFSYETIDVIFINADGIGILTKMYNSSRSSVKLSECNVVKIMLENNYYSDPENFNEFSINGIVNNMAVTDIINTLGTPSHFYKVSDTCYYLDYFITKKDRRNGITVYINPIDGVILSVEYSYYK